jgi:hypothetical protein
MRIDGVGVADRKSSEASLGYEAKGIISPRPTTGVVVLPDESWCSIRDTPYVIQDIAVLNPAFDSCEPYHVGSIGLNFASVCE